MNEVYASLPRTIFDVMSGLARETGAVNLGQGFPDADGPRDIIEKAADALLKGPNQYAPMMGLPALREAVAEHYGRLQSLNLDWRTEVTITSGATEAIAASIFAVLNPGDHVILIEPMYDAYSPLVRRAGASASFVRLEPPHWRLSEAALRAACTEKTKAIIVNSPLNPSASLIAGDDLASIARLCVERDLIAICDEVWEHITFDGRRHQPLISAPGMRERAIKIGSAGKMFSMTGWKIGFVCAPPPLTEAIAKAHQFLTFATAPNLQSAAAYGLAKSASFFDAMRADFERARDRLARALAREGFAVLPCAGTYFLNIDLGGSGVELSAEDFALRAVKEHGVASIPLTPFYAAAPTSQLVRLCFAKSDETLDRGVERLSAARRALI